MRFAFISNLLRLILITAFVGTAGADTIILKDGTKVTGEILTETPENITIEYFMTRTIKDQKTLNKEDIDKVERISKDQKAFEELGSLETPPTVLDPTFHDLLVSQKLPAFIATYPYSTHLPEIRDRLKILSDERAKLGQGDRKVDGTWISSAEIAANPYQMDSLIKFTAMKTEASNNPVEALRNYELIEKSYPGSSVIPDAIVLALLQLDQLQKQISVAKTNVEIAQKNMARAIASAPADQAKLLNDEIEREGNRIKAAIKTSAADGTKFFPVFQNNKEALDALLAVVQVERVRLTQLQKIAMKDGIAAAKSCATAIATGSLKTAQEQLALSEKLWPTYVENAKLRQQVEILSKSQAAAEAAKVKAGASPVNK